MSLKRPFLWLVAGLCLLLVILIFTDWLPVLRGPAPGTSEWYWVYQLRPYSRWWATLLAAFLALLANSWWLGRPETKSRTVLLLAVAVTHFWLQLGLIYADRPQVAAELVDRTLSNLSGGYFAAAAETTAISPVLRAYPEAMTAFASDHLRTHPPGLFALNWAVTRFFTAIPESRLTNWLVRQVVPLRCQDLWLFGQPAPVAAALAVMSLLPLLAASLAVFPAYGLARRLLSPFPARLATALVGTLPALLLFAPQSDQFFPPLALLVFYCWWRGLAEPGDPVKRRWAWFLATGVVLSLLTFLSLGNAALLLPLALFLLLWLVATAPTAGHRSLGQAIDSVLTNRLFWQAGLLLLLGTGTLWLVYWLVWGVAPWQIAAVGLQQHYTIVNQYRRYEWWIIHNLIDLVVFAGLPLMLGFVAAVVTAVGRQLRPFTPDEQPITNDEQPTTNDQRSSLVVGRSSPLYSLALALAVFILFLNFSGSTRAEVGRIWLFFMPLLALVSGGFLGQRVSATTARLLVTGQLLLAVSLGLAWQPLRAVIVVAQQPALEVTAVAGTPLEQLFGDTIALEGYSLDQNRIAPGGVVWLTLHWRAKGSTLRPYTVFIHLIDAQGHLVAQQDNWPVQGQWPPTCWQRGDLVVDPYAIDLANDLPAGAYSLFVGLYDAADGQRVLLPDGRDAFPLTTINVGP
jgi:hypothetical protein